jgi:transketolase
MLNQESVDKPTCVVAHTVKGKGVAQMENQVVWHYKCPSDEELEKALEELR